MVLVPGGDLCLEHHRLCLADIVTERPDGILPEEGKQRPRLEECPQPVGRELISTLWGNKICSVARFWGLSLLAELI